MQVIRYAYLNDSEGYVSHIAQAQAVLALAERVSVAGGAFRDGSENGACLGSGGWQPLTA